MLDVFCKFRLGYLDEGILVRDIRKLRENYKGKRKEFLSDVIAALPTDKIVIILSSLTSLLNRIFPFMPVLFLEDRISVALRLPKLFKWRSAVDFFNNSDMRTNSPNIVRACKLLLVLATIIHWIACFYFLISKYEGLGINDWVLEDYLSESNFFRSYLRSLYWSTMTLTTIGNTSNPKTDLEYVFTGLTFLIGVFLFAAVVGNVGDVISNMHAARVQFQLKMDALKFYMAARRVPSDLQKRVKKWADYAWQNTHVLEDQELLDMLPYRLRSDIAQHVHLETLRKIRVFEECESGFLCELVTKLKSHVYSPADYVCRAGEIGREMYIINNGKVEVLIRDHTTEDQTVVATLSEGNYFGEISVLRLDSGINRRNADVRSVGFSELLVLSKKDLTQVLYEYPEARVVIENYARERYILSNNF
ncbi:DgyrCDS11410 [Dimorphilus gyrociliatus]|uniref:DgyrCDS11410 n=1 Tax=Dimorphilus gyrociliatus TaxID=2664684 RepID=A0A7I8W7V8_9ANNE|nr:DgyrCDS11410 [Dimorphilus gyrociliatus]